jgi:hypothetical protein
MHAVGALQGLQKRVVVCYRVGNLTSNTTAAAIVADPSSMSLPAGIHGLAGLQFLRQFRRWGAERTESGWRFYLETDGV